MMKWIEENPVLFVIVLIIIAGAVMAVAGLKEAGLASLTGAFGVLSDKLNSKKKETDDAKDNIDEQRKITDELLGEIEHEAQQGNLSGDDVATAFNDVIARVRNRHSQ